MSVKGGAPWTPRPWARYPGERAEAQRRETSAVPKTGSAWKSDHARALARGWSARPTARRRRIAHKRRTLQREFRQQIERQSRCGHLNDDRAANRRCPRLSHPVDCDREDRWKAPDD